MRNNLTTQKDDNGYPTIWGVSCVDGQTLVKIQFNPSNGGLKVDTTTTISYTPPAVYPATDGQGAPIAKAVSTVDGKTIVPWNVNPTNGAVLITLT